MKLLVTLSALPALCALFLCLLALPATARSWDTEVAKDEMTGESQIYVSSPAVRPKKALGFPYQDVRAWIGVGCDAGSEWAYVGFNEAPNLTDTDAQSGGYSTFWARIKWDDRLETVAMIQRWGERFLHFRNDDSALLAMMASREALLELEWYGAGAAYFRFDLAGAEPVIMAALTRCRASAMQDSYDIKTIQLLLLRAGFDPGPLDGLWGSATVGALSRFQSSREMTPSGRIDMETLHRLGYRGPGSKPLASLSVRRAAPEISGNTQERMESVLANIRRMKDQAQLASDLRAEEAETLLHDQVMNCWRADSPTVTAKGMPVEMVVTLTEAGALAGQPQIIDAQRLNSDRDFLVAAYVAARSVERCSPFNLPSDSHAQWQKMILTFRR